MKKVMILLVLAGSLWAQAPEMFRYQGRLVDGTNLVNATLPMSFKLYDAQSSGTLVYEDSNSVLVVDGLYSTTIGDNTIFGSLTNALTNATVYLELTVNGETLSPRERLVSVPYSLNTSEAGLSSATNRLAGLEGQTNKWNMAYSTATNNTAVLALKADLTGANLTNMVAVPSTNFCVVTEGGTATDYFYGGMSGGSPWFSPDAVSAPWIQRDNETTWSYYDVTEQLVESVISSAYYPWNVPWATITVAQGTTLTNAAEAFWNNLDGDSKVGGVTDALTLKASNTNLIERSVLATNRITIVGNGQSNMDGYPAGYDLLPDEALSGISNCFYAHYGQRNTTNTNTWDYVGQLKKIDTHSGSIISWGVELPVCKSLRGQMPDTEIYFVKSAVGSSAISAWTNGGTYWKYVTNAWTQAQAAWTNPTPKYFIHMQGETESSSESASATYYARTVQMISDLRTYYGNTNMVCILAGLPAYYYNTNFGSVVEQAKINAAASNANVYYVQMFDVPETGSHYNQANMLTVGGRIAELIYSLEAQRDYSEPVHTKRITAQSGAVNGTFEAGEFTRNGVPLAEFITKTISGELLYPIPVSLATNAGITVRFKPYDATDLGLSTNLLVVDSPSIGFEPGVVGGYLSVRDESDVVGLPKVLDSVWTNTDFTVFIRVRPQYDINTNGPVTTWSWHCYQANTTNKAPTITSRNAFNNGSADAYKQQLAMYSYDNPINETFLMRNGLESNVWHSIAFTVARASKVVTAYFDGELDTQWTSATTNEWTSNWYSPASLTSIGGRYSAGTSSQFSLCDFADFVLLPRALTAFEIWCLEKGQPIEGE